MAGPAEIKIADARVQLYLIYARSQWTQPPNPVLLSHYFTCPAPLAMLGLSGFVVFFGINEDATREMKKCD